MLRSTATTLTVRKLARAIGPLFDRLEHRRLLSGDTSAVQPLPIALSFGGPVAGTVADAAGAGTGFTSVQPNKSGTEYQPGLVQLRTDQNQLSLTTTGTGAAGGSWEGDNTLVNAVQTGFDATAGAFTVTARLAAPLSIFASPSQQGGVFFGPDQDNYVKLVAVSQPNGQVLQFVDEQHPAGTTTYTHAVPTASSYTSIGSFSSINTLDVRLSADPATGKVSGAYAVDGGPFVAVSQSVTLTGTERSAFFAGVGHAGLIAMAKNNLAPISVHFGSFAVAAVATAAPTLTGLSPASAPTGSGDTTVALTGTNFASTAVATLNGSPIATTYVSPTRLTAVIPAASLTAAATLQVAVATPNQATTAALAFFVAPAAATPTLSGVSPSTAPAGSGNTTVTLTGTNFGSTSTANVNGSAVATTFVSATQLTAVVPAASLATAGTLQLTVATPNQPTTAAVAFTVTAAAAPTLAALSPSSAVAGSGDATVTLTGTGFGPASVATVNGSAVATTYASPTQLTAVFPAALLATAGTLQVTVATPNQPTTAALPFTVTSAPATTPTLTGLSPSSAAAGAAATSVTLTGTNFSSASTASVNGSAVATSYVSPTQLTAVIPASALASAGTLQVAVLTPNAGTTAALAFTVTAAPSTTPTLTALSPSSAVAGSAATAVALAGTNFSAASTATVNGSPVATTYVSPTQLTAVVPAASLATAGTLQVAVVTPNLPTTAALAFTVTATPTPTPTPTGTPANPPAGSVKLSGITVGTAGSYKAGPNTIAKATDGDLGTYFDGPAADGNTVGLNLGSPAQITQVQYAPRAGSAARMVGGVVQASNTADFSAGVVDLFTITAAPANGVYTARAVATDGGSGYQYVRYRAPAGSYGNVAELEFDGVPVAQAPTTSATPAAPPAGSAALGGQVIGTSGSYANNGNTIAKAFDTNLNTYYDGATANGNWAGLNLGAPAQVTQVQYAPRSAAYASRMVGGAFQASSTADFSADVVTLFTVTAAPTFGVYTVQPIANAAARQYVRYLSPAGSYGNVAEVRFAGLTTVPPSTTSATPAAPPAGSTKLTGTLTGTTGAYANGTATIDKATDGSLATYVDGPTADGNTVGLAFATTAAVTQVQYAPRSASTAARMVGGVFQGSTTADFSAGVVNLFTVTVAPTAGVYTVQPVAYAGQVKYVRYVSPAGSYGNVAEVEFDGVAAPAPVVPPSVISSTPAAAATGVERTAFVSCNLNLPNGGINQGTLKAANVYLYRTADKALVDAVINTDAAGSVIVLQPSSPLAALTSYTFVVTSGLKDVTGQSFAAYQVSFTTGSAAISTDPNVAFSQTELPTSAGQSYSGVVVGPDGNLYASTLDGNIVRFPIAADGTLGTPTTITAVASANGGPRLITGIAFSPDSTATNLTLWVSHGSGVYSNAPDFTGKISVLTGPDLGTYRDAVINLPRSNSNHLNNQPVFGPDGALYWSQGSNSSMGAADPVWGNRPEHLLNAAVLRLDVAAIAARFAAGQGAVNAQTDSLPAGQTAYNPYAAGAPLTLYATGIRNAYDLVFDDNGHLYVPTNGSAAGGNIPGTPAGVTPSAPALTNVPVAEDDYLFDVKKGGYYGHPNPTRGEYVFGGGNPTVPIPNYQVQTSYPKGTNPDPNYRGYAYSFGAHYSPDGAIEYHGSAFGGALDGALLVTRYSGGKDLQILRTAADGSITGSETGVVGFTGFEDPVDLTENLASGYLYVVELGGAKLTLLKPIASGASILASQSTLYYNDPQGGSASPKQTVTITNTGNQPLAIPATGINLAGADGSLFLVSDLPALPATVLPGASISFSVAFNAAASSLGLHAAQLQIQSNDMATPLLSLNLRALSTAGTGGSYEPSFQRLLDLFQIPDNVGMVDPTQTAFPASPLTPNDEVVLQQLQKVDLESPVTVTPLAVFSGSASPSAGFGTYTAGTPNSRVPLFTFSSADAQTVHPTALGTTTFDPGTGSFGIYTSFDSFPNAATGTARNAYSEDLFNTYDTTNTRKVRFYPLKNADGSVVPNAYVFATEDYGVAPYYDSNDVIGIIRNVKAAPAGAVIGTQNVSGTTDVEGAPSPTQFSFNAIADTTSVTPNNVVHNTNTLRIDNSGSQPLVISSITSSNAFFSVATAITFPITVAPGTTLDLQLKYAPTHSGVNAIDTGTLSVVSNDPLRPTVSLKLAGFWQQRGNITLDHVVSETGVAQLVNTVFGYTTTITNPGQNIDTGGRTTAVGEEVLSQYWTRADTNLPLTVRQLASFHTQGNGATIYWYKQGTPTSYNTITNSDGLMGQAVLPYASVSSKKPSFGSVSPTGSFGFAVDKSEYSDDSLNKVSGSDQGHHMRFWPARDATGAVIPNTWIVGQDYQGINFDYNDNIYLVTNMRPAAPLAPTNLAAAGTTAGVTVTWTAVYNPLLVGYNVLRSTSKTGTFAALTTTPVTTPSYVDTTATTGVTYYYTVESVDKLGAVSTRPTPVAGTRLAATSGRGDPDDGVNGTLPPAIPPV